MPKESSKPQATISTLRTFRHLAIGAVFAFEFLGHAPGHKAAHTYAASGESPAESCPSFAIKLDDGTFVEYAKPTGRRDEGYLFADSHLEAVVTPLPNHQWELKIQTKNVVVKEIWFPWEPRPEFINEDLDDDVLYYPHLMGVAWGARWVNDLEWTGREYPGFCFSPLMVIADGTDARMVAAVNWPPRKVSVVYRRYRLGLRYDEILPADSTSSYRAMVARVHGADVRSASPWHVAIDPYKEWLAGRLKAEGLLPIPYPFWMKNIEGWQNVQLENLRDEELPRVRKNWNRFKSHFPWLQMWGQMSNFYPTEGEETGCCLDRPEMHPRYRSFVPDLVRTVAAEGHVGFYSRPKSPYGSMTGTGEADRQNLRFFVDWIEHNRVQLGANAFYLDVLGADYFGDALTLAKMFGRTFPRESVIEHAVDVYPAAFLISGSLCGAGCDTSPGQTPKQLGKNRPCVTFPRFGRYILDDRMIFLGESNGDHCFWGTARGYSYWTERQVFLLGAKFDAIHIAESERHPDRLNRALELTIKERKKVGWWARDPAYLDTVGLSEIPEGVEVRRFRGNKGEDLLVIDNWKRRAGQHLRFLGRLMNIPETPISILVVEP